MSCNTWSYKKVSALTDDEKKIFSDKAIQEAISWWGFKYSKEEFIAEVEKWYIKQPHVFNVETCGTPIKYAMNLIKEYTKKRDDILQGDSFGAWLMYHKNDYPNCFVHNGEQYVKIACNTPFRCYEFLEGFVTSKDELLNLLKKQKPAMIGYYDLENHNFVSGYTDELVKKIDDYYALHGEDNIMFDFG